MVRGEEEEEEREAAVGGGLCRQSLCTIPCLCFAMSLMQSFSLSLTLAAQQLTLLTSKTDRRPVVLQ